ncbi:MAG: DUF58 domain-containing protein [Clostridia bacterium]|nr:DUF58 domain-containing protein [Clostridia bacterium]
MKQAIITLVCFACFVIAFLLFIGARKMKKRAVEALEYGRALSTDGIFVGETLELTETAKNPTWFPLFNIKLEFYLPAGLTVDDVECKEYTRLTSVFNIPPYATVTKKHIIRADKRGKFVFSNASFKHRKDEYSFDIPLEFYGYPDLFGTSTDMPADILRSGNTVSSRKYIEDPFFLSSIREYRSGDPMRYINFKASVRSFSNGTRKLMCNSYDSSRCYDTMIFLDLNRYHDIPLHSGYQLETGLKYACYLFCEAVENGGRVGFAVNSATNSQSFSFIKCGSGEAHIKRLLEQFALLDNYSIREYSIAALMRSCISEFKSGTDVFIITPYVDESTAEMIADIKRAGINITLIRITGGAEI